MSRLRIACLLLVVGGLVWVARLLVDAAGGNADGGVGHALLWAGAVLVTIGTGLAAFDSVGHAPLWLQVVVAVCGPLALWMVLLAGNDMVSGSQATAAGIVGLVLVAGAGLWFVRSRPVTKHKGSHKD